jgi:hypothetical protein
VSRAGAKAKRVAQSHHVTRHVMSNQTVRQECPTCYLGVVHHIRQPRPGTQSYHDLHALACGCAHDGVGGSYCNFGDGWMDAE